MVAFPDDATLEPGETIKIDVLENDDFSNCEDFEIVVSVVEDPACGSARAEQGNVIYESAPSCTGEVELRYGLSSEPPSISSRTPSAWVTLTLQAPRPQEDPPVAGLPCQQFEDAGFGPMIHVPKGRRVRAANGGDQSILAHAFRHAYPSAQAKTVEAEFCLMRHEVTMQQLKAWALVDLVRETPSDHSTTIRPDPDGGTLAWPLHPDGSDRIASVHAQKFPEWELGRPSVHEYIAAYHALRDQADQQLAYDRLRYSLNGGVMEWTDNICPGNGAVMALWPPQGQQVKMPCYLKTTLDSSVPPNAGLRMIVRRRQ